MSAQHTPGPWFYDRGVIPPDGPGRYSTIGGDYDTIIAEVNDLIPAGIANANLIAAAPDLLALVSRYRNETPLGNQPHMIAHEVDALIEKITGVKA